MKIEKNFTTGLLSGICGVVLILIMMGSTNMETTTKFEFHDLGDSRGLIFDKSTGKIEYTEIRNSNANSTISYDNVPGKYLPWSGKNTGKNYSFNTHTGEFSLMN